MTWKYEWAGAKRERLIRNESCPHCGNLIEQTLMFVREI